MRGYPHRQKVVYYTRQRSSSRNYPIGIIIIRGFEFIKHMYSRRRTTRPHWRTLSTRPPDFSRGRCLLPWIFIGISLGNSCTPFRCGLVRRSDVSVLRDSVTLFVFWRYIIRKPSIITGTFHFNDINGLQGTGIITQFGYHDSICSPHRPDWRQRWLLVRSVVFRDAPWF